ncbi:MAG: hypothetical protein ABJV04_15945 [Aliiglaciecola sp.]|uniref:hypothetical protein n=1 Tax=Aliiglaciecola sp. TaxID=1872441 RepID=UPI00329A2425
MSKEITSTTSAEGWFFFQKNKSDREPYSFYRLAVWATYENGETIGLLSMHKKGTFFLDAPPSGVEGGYIHWNELNPEQQKEAILQGKIVGTSNPLNCK